MLPLNEGSRLRVVDVVHNMRTMRFGNTGYFISYVQIIAACDRVRLVPSLLGNTVFLMAIMIERRRPSLCFLWSLYAPALSFLIHLLNAHSHPGVVRPLRAVSVPTFAVN